MYVCMYVYIYIYIYFYTHIYIYIYVVEFQCKIYSKIVLVRPLCSVLEQTFGCCSEVSFWFLEERKQYTFSQESTAKSNT